jgi:hypothetical protein
MKLHIRILRGTSEQAGVQCADRLDAWHHIKWCFEPRLLARAQMYLSQFTALPEATSEKVVPEALNNLEVIAQQNEERRGQFL